MPKLEYSVVESGIKKIPVIVVAAGNSTRMGGINKQFLELSGVPLIARTLLKFQNSAFISDIVIVCKADDVFAMQNICLKYKIDKVTDITEGGENRHESVIRGIKRLDKRQELCLIHDGARPFVTEEIIFDCISALRTYKGCLCAVKVSDTVKQVDADKTVIKTVPRENLYLAQTPQGVSIKEYLESSEKFAENLFTDDASVLEAAGFKVKIVEGNKNNIKITTPEDIKIAESIIERGAL